MTDCLPSPVAFRPLRIRLPIKPTHRALRTLGDPAFSECNQVQKQCLNGNLLALPNLPKHIVRQRPFSLTIARRPDAYSSLAYSWLPAADSIDIIVLKAGEVVEHGTHEELVAKGGLYPELFAMQAAGYR